MLHDGRPFRPNDTYRLDFCGRQLGDQKADIALSDVIRLLGVGNRQRLAEIERRLTVWKRR